MSEREFDFEEFIDKNELNDIKQCFIDHNMTNLDTLNMNNQQFSKLMGDETILSNAHLIQTIVIAIQSLEKLRNTNTTAEKRLIFTTPKENKTFTNMENYIDNLNECDTEIQTTINTNMKNRQQQNDQEIEKYSTQNCQKLATIDTKMNQTMSKLHDILREEEEILESKINEYRKNVKQIDLSHGQTRKNMDNTLSTCLSIIDQDIEYFQNAIKKCRDIVHKYEEETDQNSSNRDNFTFKRSNTTHRENEIIKIGTMATDYYHKNVSVLNDNKEKITNYIENELILNMKQIYCININNNIFNKLCININKLITLSNNNNIIAINIIQQKQEEIQIIHIPPANKQIKTVPPKNQNIIHEANDTPGTVISQVTEDAPAAYSQNFGISPVPIPRIEDNNDHELPPPPPRYNKNARVISKKDLKRISSQNVVENKENINVVEVGENFKHKTEESQVLDEITSNQHALLQQMEEENNNKSSSPPLAFETFWECTVCTFAENPGTFLICEVCGSSRQLSAQKKELHRQHSLSDPPLIIPQSKSEFRARSDSNEARVNALKSSGDNNSSKSKRFQRSQSAVGGKKKKGGGIFGWNKKQKKSPKSKNKKKVQQ